RARFLGLVAPPRERTRWAQPILSPRCSRTPLLIPTPASRALLKNMAQPIKGVGGEVEDHSKASGLGEVFRPHTCPH
ncbi:MAG: hypothetical protein II040_03455, partial [Muribaculaceae bacterium]|nr:hypothetical protein [Muribaculaceae bacterium]